MSEDYVWLTEPSHQFLKKDYLKEGQTLDERIWAIGNNAERILNKPGFAAKFVEYMKQGYYSLSTPIWTNFGSERGLPISCFGSFIGDSIEDIMSTISEVAIMSKNGGGTSGYFGAVRGRGALIQGGANGKTSGSVHFMRLFETTALIISQGSQRRGQFAAYQDIEHPDIMEFLDIRRDGSELQDINTGVCVPDRFIDKIKKRDPEAMKVWARVLESRSQTGYPYIFFTDAANNGRPQVYIDNNMWITHSNLCTEIMEPDTEDESFVCDLMSMNAVKFPDWKSNPDVVSVAIHLLDAVMTEFIKKASNIKYMEKAVKFAKRHRAIGLGIVGLHSLYQSQSVVMESEEGFDLNRDVFRTLQKHSKAASKVMAAEYGEPELLKGYGYRHTVTNAIAPTKSSAFILGVSEGVEMEHGISFIKDLAKGKFRIDNPYFKNVLQKYGQDTEEVWDSILVNRGSVQHLDFLSDHEKAVYRTFLEADQRNIIRLAGERQRYIDQGQSLNIVIRQGTSVKDINALHLLAHEVGLKSLYYQINTNAAQEFTRDILCESCAA